MYFKASALALVLTASLDCSEAFGITGQHSSFVSKPLRLHATAPTYARHNVGKSNMSMFGGEVSGGIEELQELTKEGDKLSKTVRKTPGLFKVGGIAAVPLSAALGAVMTPSRRLAASAVGSAITGVAGFIGKNRIDVATGEAAKPALAQILIDNGIDSPDIHDDLLKVKESFGVDDEDFVEMCTDIYKRYIIGMVKMPLTKTSEMKELTNLRNALGLDNLSVGEAHAAAAKSFYHQTSLFTPLEDLEDPEHPDRMSMDKFLFLSERTFRQGDETAEAFKFEMSRVAKAFDIDMAEAMDRVAEVANPFYEKALASTRTKLDSDAVTSDMLLRARKSLGVDTRTAEDMHLLTFAEEVKSLLGKNNVASEDELATLKFPPGAQERLGKLQDILGLEDREADYEVSAEATPLFQAKALSSMNAAIAGTINYDVAWEEMKVRQDELLLKDDAMKDLLSSIVVQAMGTPLEDTMTFAKVNNEGATYEKILAALEAKKACNAVLNQSGWEEFKDFDKTFFDPFSKSSACGFLNSTDRLRLYRIFLKRSVRNSESGKELTDENFDKVKEVQKMLGISDSDEAAEFRMTFGPELQKSLNMAMLEIIGDDFTTELVTNLKKMVDKVISDYKLPPALVAEFAAPIYSRAVSAISDKTPSSIPTAESMVQLDALRDLLGLSKDDTFSSHLAVFGAAYKSSILESMGSTGIITKEYRQPLEDLRDRLGVSKEASRALFLEAVEERFKPMVEWVVLELERTMLTAEQLANKRQRDYGEDYFKTGKSAQGSLGIGAEANIMTDCMNIIEFYTDNDIAEKNEIGTKIVEKKVMEGDEEKTVEEEVPDYETVYPITALGSCDIQQELVELLYRQFVVGGFTAQGPQGQRYEASRFTFGQILGLEKEKMDEITGSIGQAVYENYIGNSMRTKGTLDQQDMMFLANIQGKLNISSEESEKMLLAIQKKFLLEEADVVLGDDATPQSIKAFREKCNSMGMELESEVGISRARIEQMFEKEVSPGLASGDITIESGDVLSEIQESLGLSPEDAETLFEGILDRRAKSAISRVKGELLRGREDEAVPILHRLVRYSYFVGGAFDLGLDESTAWQIFNVYDSIDFEGVESETVEKNKSLLKIALGLEN